MDFKVVIPARYDSTRLPGKPLLDIAGRPMIRHVYERACESAAGQIVIATDDERIAAVARACGAEVCLTDAAHRSGTDRVAEVARRLGWPADAIVVNLQGDEPCMPAALIDQVAADMAAHADSDITTLSAPVRERETLFDPHVVKVVTDARGYALYFSRAPIPWHRDGFLVSGDDLPTGVEFARHIGLYAYRAAFLERFVSWPPAPLEQAESLEQLRVLWQGGRIHVTQARVKPGHGVDTADDLRLVTALLQR